jgi:hypothetical protein
MSQLGEEEEDEAKVASSDIETSWRTQLSENRFASPIKAARCAHIHSATVIAETIGKPPPRAFISAPSKSGNETSGVGSDCAAAAARIDSVRGGV